MPALPWDRLPEESADSYARFLYYRNLGPLRSQKAAYLTWLRERDGFTGGSKRLHVPGHWSEESVRFQWVERAGAWDARNLLAYGNRLAALQAESLAKIARTNLRYAARLKPGDDAWQDLMAGIKVVAAHLTAHKPADDDADKGKPGVPVELITKLLALAGTRPSQPG